MAPRPNYTLYIGGYTPDTIPMARLAEYMQQFAAMLGSEEAVHFRGLEPGSAQVVAEVEAEAAPDVEQRLAQAAESETGSSTVAAFQKVFSMLREDQAAGFVYKNGDQGQIVVTFEGATRLEPTFGPFWEEGSLEGILIRIGGEGDTKHLQLKQGTRKYSRIEADEETARLMRNYLFEPVRIVGRGRWKRNEFGNWDLLKFQVKSFKPLDNSDLEEVVAQLQSIKGSDWSKMDDPIAVALSLRDDDSDLS